ncbi:hypothetical protein B0H10DRAFT_2436313 [Mycena sp. CBHHK59/15]|nr:hypothetical protein B0H10DRAFT_2436313 [Mycena sp. CBHHK59/15]
MPSPFFGSLFLPPSSLRWPYTFPMPPKPSEKEPVNVKWMKLEVLVVLNGLLKKKDSHQCGNGWKPTVWPEIVSAVQAVNLEVKPAKDQVKIVSKLNYLKEIFELYLFVEKFSSTGWDDEANHATNTEEYIKDFIAAHGKKYAPCFKKACPFYAKLNELYDGLTNHTMGENVVHFTKKRKPCTKAMETAKENPIVADPGSLAKTTSAVQPCAPMAARNNVPEEEKTIGSQGGLYDDELTESPAKLSTKQMRAETDDDAEDTSDTKGKRRRHKSDSSKAGSHIACSVDNLSAAMLKPIVTSEDISFVDDVMNILEDSTLLLPDPEGELFDIISTSLTSSHTRACIFVLAGTDTRRKGIIKCTLKDAGVTVPDDY